MEEEEKEEQRSDPALADNICPFCSTAFSSKGTMTRHITEQHEANPEQPSHVCQECGAGFTRSGTLQIHTRDKHSDTQVLNGPKSARRTNIRRFCVSGFPIQGGNNPDIKAQRESIRRNYASRNHACRFCDAVFTRKFFLTGHIRAVHESNGGNSKAQDHICHFCGAGYTARCYLTRHIRSKHESSYGRDELPFAGRRTRLLVDDEDFRADPLKVHLSNIQTETDMLNLTAGDFRSTPSLPSLETIKRARRPPQRLGYFPDTPAGNLRSASARSDSQNEADLRSSSPGISHTRRRGHSPVILRSAPARSNSQTPATSRSTSLEIFSPNLEKFSCTRRRGRPPKTNIPDSAEPIKRTRESNLVKARLVKAQLVKEQRLSRLRNAQPKNPVPTLLPPPESRRKPEVSVAGQLLPAPERQANQANPSSTKNVVFHFFLADEQHGAIRKTLENCDTMGSFFDEAQAAWDTLGEEQHQPRMVAVKVIIEDVTRPIVVLWRNKEGFDGMMDSVLEHAAGKETKLNVEVYCFKRG